MPFFRRMGSNAFLKNTFWPFHLFAMRQVKRANSCKNHPHKTGFMQKVIFLAKKWQEGEQASLKEYLGR